MTSVATHWNGTASSSNVRAVSRSSSARRRPALSLIASPRRASATAAGNTPRGISSLPSSVAPQALHAARRRRSWGPRPSPAPLMAPTEHPSTGRADAPLDQRPQHPDLQGAEVAAAGQHEGHRPPPPPASPPRHDRHQVPPRIGSPARARATAHQVGELVRVRQVGAVAGALDRRAARPGAPCGPASSVARMWWGRVSAAEGGHHRDGDGRGVERRRGRRVAPSASRPSGRAPRPGARPAWRRGRRSHVASPIIRRRNPSAASLGVSAAHIDLGCPRVEPGPPRRPHVGCLVGQHRPHQIGPALGQRQAHEPAEAVAGEHGRPPVEQPGQVVDLLVEAGAAAPPRSERA